MPSASDLRFYAFVLALAILYHPCVALPIWYLTGDVPGGPFQSSGLYLLGFVIGNLACKYFDKGVE